MFFQRHGPRKVLTHSVAIGSRTEIPAYGIDQAATDNRQHRSKRYVVTPVGIPAVVPLKLAGKLHQQEVVSFQFNPHHLARRRARIIDHLSATGETVWRAVVGESRSTDRSR